MDSLHQDNAIATPSDTHTCYNGNAIPVCYSGDEIATCYSRNEIPALSGGVIDPTCYICHEEESAVAPFCRPSPCKCTGSIQIHARCLFTLQQTALGRQCSICKQPYKPTTPNVIHYTPAENGTQWVEFINSTGQRLKYQITAENKVHGLMYVYHPSGRIYSKTPYIYGAMHGLAEYFNDDEHSTLLQTRPYVAGQREGTSHLYYPGTARHIHKILNYSRNKLHGQSLVFNPTGVVIQSYNYVEGHLDGLYCEYYDTGVMRLETLFQGGRRRYTNTFNSRGALMKKTVYN